MELKAEIREALREKASDKVDKKQSKPGVCYSQSKTDREKSKLQKRVKTTGGNLVESICRGVSTSISNGKNWEDVQNTAEAAKERRVQQQKDHNAFYRGGIKGHHEKVTHELYENSPDQMLKTIDKVEELTVEEETLERNNELIVHNPSFEEVRNEITKMKDAVPGEDEIRLRCIREAADEIRKSVYRKIQWLWENPAHRWNNGQNVGIIIPLHMKGDKKDMNNFRGLCLLPIMSRILARIMVTRLRIWAEATGTLE